MSNQEAGTLLLPQGDHSPKTYVVIGAPRSGTSFLAKALIDAGVEMHPSTQFFEDLAFRELNIRIIKDAGGAPERPPSQEALTRAGAAHADDIATLIRSRQSDFWGWKDPRTSLMLDSYLPHLEDDVYLIAVFRKPKRVAASMRQWDHTKPGLEMALATEYQQRAVAAIQAFLAQEQD